MRCSSDGSHGKCLSILIIGIIEIVLAFSKVDEFEFVVGEEEDIGRFDISVADSLRLKKGTGGDHARIHGD